MSSDLDKTIHYTTKAHELCSNLLQYIPSTAVLVEPFAGGGDLVKLFPNHKWELYDIKPNYPDTITQDTLLNPPNYAGKWIITNPPFLAKNKAKEKDIFAKYKSDDLYKIFIETSLGCEGGIFIIPQNFFTDERTKSLRKKFLSEYLVLELNIYSYPTFVSTTYNICAFAFVKKPNESQTILCNLNNKDKFTLTLENKYDYQIGGDFLTIIDNQKNIFGRLAEGVSSLPYLTKIKLYGLDDRTQKIHLTYGEEPYIGKASDRVFATFTSSIDLSDDTQKELVDLFNKTLNEQRDKHHNMLLTNYRDWGRKRIGFTFAYNLLSYCYYQLQKESL